MLLPALLALSVVQQRAAIPFHVVMTTEAKSPHTFQATLIRDKRRAFEFFYLVKDGSPKPESIKKLNWKRSNVLIVYPGLVQKDSKISLKSIKRNGHTVRVTLERHRGISAEAHYPVLVLTVPKLEAGVAVDVIDPLQLRSSARRKVRGS